MFCEKERQPRTSATAVAKMFFRREKGCVAKIDYRDEGSESHLELGSNPEQACHESDLPPNIRSFHSLNLSFPDHIHCLIALDCPTRRVETGKPEPGIDSSFNEPMVLLDDIIEIFALSEL